MATTIGEVNINLRMSMAQFKRDVQDGTDGARSGIKAMSDDIKTNTFEARGTLSLLGEEIGVHIPRHLQTMLAGLPGVGAALEAAFSAVAVIALLEVIIKIAEKIEEFTQKAKAAADALKKSGEIGQDAFHKLQEEILALDAQLAEVSGNHLQALRDKLHLIDEQNMDALVGEIDKIGKAADDAISKIQSAFLDSLTTLGKNHREILGIQQDLDATVEHVKEFQRVGDKITIGLILEGALQRVNTQLAGSKNLTDDVVKALEIERDRLQDMQKGYDLVNTKITKQKELQKDASANEDETLLQAQIRAREELTNKVNQLTAATQRLLAGEQTQSEILITKYEEQIQKLRELDAERQAQVPGIKTVYGTEIASLERMISLTKEQEAIEQAQLARGVVPGVNKLETVTAPEPKPLFNGPTSALELEKVKTDEIEANAAAVEIIDSVQTQNQKFKEQVALLDALKSKGLLTQQQYDRAFQAAEAEADKLTGSWKKFGTQISGTVEQALTFQKSWGQALKEILADFIKIIVQMEIMKALGKSGISGSGNGGGIGGFLGAVFGGFKATGGPVDAAHAYIVGEHGPELFAPKGAGTIVPNGHMVAQPQVTYQHIQNITTPDADSFQKSSAQIAADAYENMAASHARNR